MSRAKEKILEKVNRTASKAKRQRLIADAFLGEFGRSPVINAAVGVACLVSATKREWADETKESLELLAASLFHDLATEMTGRALIRKVRPVDKTKLLLVDGYDEKTGQPWCRRCHLANEQCYGVAVINECVLRDDEGLPKMPAKEPL